MKKVFVLFALSTIVTLCAAQERIKEIGLVFQGLNSFGLTYKVGSSTCLWRLHSMNINSSSDSKEGDATVDVSNISFGARGGREYRQDISDDFQFRYGFDLSFSYGRYKYDDPFSYTEERSSFSPGLNAVIGFNYVFKERLVLGAEILPGLSYTTGTEKNKSASAAEWIERDLSNLSVGLSSSAAFVTLAYRIVK